MELVRYYALSVHAVISNHQLSLFSSKQRQREGDKSFFIVFLSNLICAGTHVLITLTARDKRRHLPPHFFYSLP